MTGRGKIRVKIRSISLAVMLAVFQSAPVSVTAEESSGAYLAARQARYSSDYAVAAEYLVRALAKDPSNAEILEHTIAAYISLGRIDSATPFAHRMEENNQQSQAAQMVLLAAETKAADYDAILKRVSEGRGISPLADGLISAWATLGQGDMSAALLLFDKVAKERGLRGFAIYHKALALASVGDFESADKIYSGESDGPMQTTRRGTIAWVEVLSQLERNEDAIKVITDTFGSDLDPQMSGLRDSLARGERLPFSRIPSAQEGIAEVFFSLGRALLSETGEDYVLLYSRIAENLSDSHIDARIMSAELLEKLERYDLATEAYKSVPRDHPMFHVAELGRSEALRKSEKTDAAIEVLEQLSGSHPELAIVHATAGDMYRQLEQFDKASAAYDEAIRLYAKNENNQWFVFYARAISLERQDKWDLAEADFRKALELSPEQPEILNYLGYSLVEKQIKLDEALNMIERAVAAQPNSGFIVDSLGWVLYRLGRYSDAIGHMERAAELMPVDPVVNDHLGDVLWSVGRFTEAEFQWKRALSFVDENSTSQDVQPDRIRRKIEVGLDQVLEEEGSEPLEMANEDG